MGTPEIVWSCIALVISIASFVVAAYFYQWVKKLPVANARMEEVGKLIRDGAFTFLKREYRILGIFRRGRGAHRAVLPGADLAR